jgi:chorismate mutase
MDEPERPEASAVRGVRGAITVDGDGREPLARATFQLLDGLVAENALRIEDLAAAIFTVPDDLPGTNPAAAARERGWAAVPLLMVREHGGDRRVPRCLRVLLLWNTTRSQAEVRHVYLRGAAELRPDLSIAP